MSSIKKSGLQHGLVGEQVEVTSKQLCMQTWTRFLNVNQINLRWSLLWVNPRRVIERNILYGVLWSNFIRYESTYKYKLSWEFDLIVISIFFCNSKTAKIIELLWTLVKYKIPNFKNNEKYGNYNPKIINK